MRCTVVVRSSHRHTYRYREHPFCFSIPNRDRDSQDGSRNDYLLYEAPYRLVFCLPTDRDTITETRGHE
ncbi:hypothetical protein NY2A_b601R [Paramecium bursaria Chlorella virus NY2A]|uniref:Uncharacterized protein b601R n=1 Tax=Paramecium bursaria Chlorella virus NY2A TaxID=46021 RepID=A7IXC6_PBCVN|nr:hypothetical protein NY2A_b601R [Paramecium bursaria Chlorella virus NY2A]ABT15000.1 hypothetical protein NY2A_b601R [Paramecium bursaria Chlorella virus NY2A]